MTVKTRIRYMDYSDSLEMAITYTAYNGEKFAFPSSKFIKTEPYQTPTFLSSEGDGPEVKEILQSIMDAA